MLPIGSRGGRKYPPPEGWTGHGAPMPSSSDVGAWIETHGDRNIGLRLPPGVIGLDVDDYAKDGETKHGGRELQRLVTAFGPLPPTWITSARSDGVSGIRLFRVPLELDGREINWPGEAAPNIEIIQTGHRYALVWPSVNPEAGGARYEWRAEASWSEVGPPYVVPVVDHLPWLPEAWVRGLALSYDRAEKSDLATGDLASWYHALPDGEPCATVDRVCTEAVQAVATQAASRHETTRDAVRALVAFGGEGHVGTSRAVHRLLRAFDAAVGAERAASGEFGRLLEGAVRLAAKARPTPAPYDPCRPPDVTLNGVTLAPPTPTQPAAMAQPVAAGSLTLPDEFWRARPSLSLIRQAAHSRVRSADVVFYGVLVRLAALVPHELRVNTGIGSRGSLNCFAAIVGPSGAGKSSGLSVAREALPSTDLEEVPLGSGEGLAEAYMGMVSVDDPNGAMTRDGSPKRVRQKAQVRHNVLAHADEGASLNKMIERTGSTVGEALRSAWSGETIGQKNGREETTRIVPGGKYSLGLLIGYQLKTLGPLLADVDAGTPQRFLYGWAIDPTIPGRADRVEWPGTIASPFPPDVEDDAPAPGGLPFGQPKGRDLTPITFAEAITHELYDRQHDKASNAGSVHLVDPYRSQHDMLKIKTAALLALLDGGRRKVSEEDWRLAQLVLDTSDRVRAYVQQQAAHAAREAWERETHAASSRALHAHVTLAAHGEAEVSQAVMRVAMALAVKVHMVGSLSRSDARKTVSSSRRRLFDDAVDAAVAAGWVVEDDRKLTAGASLPAGVALVA